MFEVFLSTVAPEISQSFSLNGPLGAFEDFAGAMEFVTKDYESRCPGETLTWDTLPEGGYIAAGPFVTYRIYDQAGADGFHVVRTEERLLNLKIERLEEEIVDLRSGLKTKLSQKETLVDKLNQLREGKI